MVQQNQPVASNQSPESHPLANGCRRYKDRRRRPTPLFSKYTFIGSRRGNRRRNDQCHDYYVDIYDSRVVGIILLIFSFCILDGILTLVLLGRGASELNPVMDYYLKLGKGYFFTFKLIVTGSGLLTLLIHQNFKRVQKIIGGICTFYALLITYQLTLLMASVVS
jgi:hypothetical protein